MIIIAQLVLQQEISKYSIRPILMQIIEIKPSNNIVFKLPYTLTSKFIIGNLTLRSVCIYIVALHPHFISFDNQAILIDAFQEAEVNVILHWSQEMNSLFKSKLRIYIWELYDDETLNTVVAKMFNKETDGNCLMFQEMNIQVEIDHNYLQTTPLPIPHAYSIHRIKLPNSQAVPVTELMINKVLNHSEKVGKVKAIYTYGNQFVVEFCLGQELIGSFCQVRDKDDKLALYGIGCIPNLGFIVYSPNILLLNYPSTDSPKLPTRKVEKQSSARKESELKKSQADPQIEPAKVDNQQALKESSKVSQHRHANNKIVQQIKQKINEFQTKPRGKDLVKQSFMVGQSSRGVTRKRTKSEELMHDSGDCEYQSTLIDINAINQWREAKNFQTTNKRQFQEKTIDVSKKILNMCISSDQKLVYLLLRDCVMISEVQNISSKRIIKFDPIDAQNVNLPTPMIMFNKEKSMVFANQSYIFWVSLTGEEEPDWKYVQRKQIYSIEVIEELNLLMVGGKNFSKLAYLGKSTQRSNIKIYSCGKLGKRDHLFTYDIPNCNGENVIQMKYITTKPNGTKLLLVLTHQRKIFFLRIRAFDHIQVYSCIEINQIGIQQIVSMNYHPSGNILICLQKLTEDCYCFKYMKVICSYEKIQISTESVKLPVAKYSTIFRMGGKQGNEWITAVDAQNCIYSLYLQWKQPQKTEYKSLIKDCILLNKGAIFRQNTQIRCRIIKE